MEGGSEPNGAAVEGYDLRAPSPAGSQAAAPPPVPIILPTPGGRPRRSILIALVALVVAAIVVLGVLALLGVFSPGKSGPQGITGTPVSYGQVAVAGADGVRNVSGGPWTVTVAEGIGLTSSASGLNAASVLGPGCTANPASGSPSGATLPATPTGSTAGAVALWVFLAANSSGAILMYVVTDAADYPLYVVTGSCTSSFDSLGTIAGASVVNSTEIASSANGDGGSAFLSSHPGSTQIFVLLGTGDNGANFPYWAVEYNTCGLASSGSGTLFIGLYDAATGILVKGPTTESVGC